MEGWEDEWRCEVVGEWLANAWEVGGMDEDVVVGHWLIEDGSMDEGVVSEWLADGWEDERLEDG